MAFSDDYVSKIRRHVFDLSTTNRLISGEEFSDDFIREALDFIVEDFNSSPPFDITINDESIPIALAYAGAEMYLFEAAAKKYMRNHLAYSAGGVSVDDQNKASEYQNVSNLYRQIYDREKRTQKISRNMSQGFSII